MKYLQKDEFNVNIKKRIMDLISEWDLIQEGELIALALSGGKDSVLTLHMLHELQAELDFEMVAIAVDEGIEGYRSHGMEAAQKNADLLGVKLLTKSFKEEAGFTLDEVYSFFKSACMPCGVFRRNILNKTAYEIGASKIATGHNLDDEIQSFLMSFARADLVKFSKFGPKLDVIHPQLIPRIKPLWNIPEKEVGIWAVLNDIEVHFDECPYSNLSLRAKTKDFLNRAESREPGTKKAILDSFTKTFIQKSSAKNDISKKSLTNLSGCQSCGEPSSGVICKACEMKEIIKNNMA
ncbi:MAG: TIGR00269 family protein [Methanobacteriaceae archaeon]|nr:TIGR00269 family protein [Methanobacteriaceae archaeon]MDP2837397.1 TIGR00269 family protein [Methanobacteriaceae archaeon]MDP3036020.1 TIGR00269 family protein [Methanobacteriaceae archaeon]MDP3485328.1 TIGR00269 family protein [Methanobacteriaceae archaeon]MDP3624195.1 TIGR00269 family protein [Methanobacteriaceae archaeon]